MNNVNTNRNTNVNVNVEGNNNNCCDNGWDNDYHPVATAAAVTATVMVTSAVIGSMVRTVPTNCVPVNYGGMVYQQCGSTWYQPRQSGEEGDLEALPHRGFQVDVVPHRLVGRAAFQSLQVLAVRRETHAAGIVQRVVQHLRQFLGECPGCRSPAPSRCSGASSAGRD